MGDFTIPTDSVLRRHFEQHTATLGLGAPPEDSILRRHYTQLLAASSDKAAAPAVASTAAPAQASHSAASQAAPAATPAPGRAPEKPKGWFARLMGKMFGG